MRGGVARGREPPSTPRLMRDCLRQCIRLPSAVCEKILIEPIETHVILLTGSLWAYLTYYLIKLMVMSLYRLPFQNLISPRNGMEPATFDIIRVSLIW